MNLIDTNGINHVLDNQVLLTETYYMTHDVENEAELTQSIKGKPLSDRIVSIRNHPEFKEHLYLKWYRKTLNTYRKVSFFNMTGLGDVSIIAAGHALAEQRALNLQADLFGQPDPVRVFSDDSGVMEAVARLFPNGEVVLAPFSDFA